MDFNNIRLRLFREQSEPATGSTAGKMCTCAIGGRRASIGGSAQPPRAAKHAAGAPAEPPWQRELKGWEPRARRLQYLLDNRSSASRQLELARKEQTALNDNTATRGNRELRDACFRKVEYWARQVDDYKDRVDNLLAWCATERKFDVLWLLTDLVLPQEAEEAAKVAWSPSDPRGGRMRSLIDDLYLHIAIVGKSTWPSDDDDRLSSSPTPRERIVAEIQELLGPPRKAKAGRSTPTQH